MILFRSRYVESRIVSINEELENLDYSIRLKQLWIFSFAVIQEICSTERLMKV